MSLLCFIQGHAPGAEEIWNRGYSFTRCERCRCDMLRSDGDWQTVPRGHRVVWKKGYHHHSRPAGYPRTLPALHRDVRGGVPGKWLGAWYRHFLIRTGLGGTDLVTAPDAVEAREAEAAMAPVPTLAALLAARLPVILWVRPRRSLR